MKKMKIGVAGMKDKNFRNLRKKFKKAYFLKLNPKNFFKQKDLNAIIIFTEKTYTKVLKSFFYEEKFKIFNNLSWFHFSRSGIEDYVKKTNGINFKLTTGKIINKFNVSEHCIAILLYLSRGLGIKNKNILYKKRPMDLYEKNALIVGGGNVGLSVAKKLKVFGLNVSVVNTKRLPSISFISKSYLSNEIQKVVGSFHIVINASSLNKKSFKMFDKKLFFKMKKNSIFINISRGECVNSKDLIKFAKTKKFYGIGLDVFHPESLSRNHSLRKFNNFIYTNHTAGWSENLERRYKLIEDNIKRYLKKNKLISQYNINH
jgi:phosphoglycerate dehydrogenase-like enzyme|tara:strand:+ start:5142 stop:6092 length:951 start_codon:yes stop_codon:yes gene_type:complete